MRQPIFFFFLVVVVVVAGTLVLIEMFSIGNLNLIKTVYQRIKIFDK